MQPLPQALGLKVQCLLLGAVRENAFVLGVNLIAFFSPVCALRLQCLVVV